MSREQTAAIVTFLALLTALPAPAGTNTWTTAGPGPVGSCCGTSFGSGPRGVYLGTGRAGIFTSSNSGLSWKPANDTLPLTDVQCLGPSPSNPSVMYAGGYISSQARVFKTVNGGGSWKATAYDKPSVLCLAVHPQNPSWVVACSGLAYVSTDGGDSWTFSSGPSATLRDAVFDPRDPLMVLGATITRGTLKSTDGGFSWSQTAASPAGSPVAVAIDPTSGGPLQMLFATSNFYDLFRSTNGGASWVASARAAATAASSWTRRRRRGPSGGAPVAARTAAPRSTFAIRVSRPRACRSSSWRGRRRSTRSSSAGPGEPRMEAAAGRTSRRTSGLR